MGFEPMNTGFADQRVSHFAIGAHAARTLPISGARGRCSLLASRLLQRRRFFCPFLLKSTSLLYFG